MCLTASSALVLVWLTESTLPMNTRTSHGLLYEEKAIPATSGNSNLILESEK